MLARDFLHFISLDVVALENNAIIGFAFIQNPLYINRSDIHAWRRLQFR
jgi:hypothetical protein